MKLKLTNEKIYKDREEWEAEKGQEPPLEEPLEDEEEIEEGVEGCAVCGGTHDDPCIAAGPSVRIKSKRPISEEEELSPEEQALVVAAVDPKEIALSIADPAATEIGNEIKAKLPAGAEEMIQPVVMTVLQQIKAELSGLKTDQMEEIISNEIEMILKERQGSKK